MPTKFTNSADGSSRNVYIQSGDTTKNTIIGDGNTMVVGGTPPTTKASGQPTDIAGIRNKQYRSFISYTHDEAVHAERLHSMLGAHAPRLCPCFLAAKSIAIGDNWFEQLRAALDSMTVLFVIFSDASFPKHWLHIESGAALIMNKKIIPVLHGRIAHQDLPFPYNLYQSNLRLDENQVHLANALSQLERSVA